VGLLLRLHTLNIVRSAKLSKNYDQCFLPQLRLFLPNAVSASSSSFTVCLFIRLSVLPHFTSRFFSTHSWKDLKQAFCFQHYMFFFRLFYGACHKKVMIFSSRYLSCDDYSSVIRVWMSNYFMFISLAPAGWEVSVISVGTFCHYTCGCYSSTVYPRMPAHEPIIRMYGSRFDFTAKSIWNMNIFVHVMCQFQEFLLRLR
jgi:hypothetical protein